MLGNAVLPARQCPGAGAVMMEELTREGGSDHGKRGATRIDQARVKAGAPGHSISIRGGRPGQAPRRVVSVTPRQDLAREPALVDRLYGPGLDAPRGLEHGLEV